MNTPSKLRAVVCAAIVFGVPVTGALAAQAGSAFTAAPLMQIAADDTRGEGVTRSAKVTAKDAAITAKVKTKLLADDDVKGLKIDVDTYDGVVKLSGKSETDAQMAKAAKLAASVKGVSSVTNNLTMSLGDVTGKVGAAVGMDSTPRSAEVTARDAAITAKVKTKLLADTDVAGMKIDVDTRNGVVMLTGTTATEAQMMRALELAARVEGVSSVTNQLTVPGVTLGGNATHSLGAHVLNVGHTTEVNTAVSTTETSRSASTTLKDSAISTSVKTKLLADPDVAGTKIDVDVRNKVVMLTGSVASQAQITEAGLIASQVDGVASVSNQLTVAK